MRGGCLAGTGATLCPGWGALRLGHVPLSLASLLCPRVGGGVLVAHRRVGELGVELGERGARLGGLGSGLG